MLEMETFGSEITRPLTRVLYSDNTNVAILAKDSQSPKFYNLIASFKPLNTIINYTDLLTPGFKNI
jgi:hypothetical protein